MKLFALSTFLSVALAANVHIVTQTQVNTVYQDGPAPSAPVEAPEAAGSDDVVVVTVLYDQDGNLLTPSILNVSNGSNSSNFSSEAASSSYYSAEPVQFTPNPTTLVTKSAPAAPAPAPAPTTEEQQQPQEQPQQQTTQQQPKPQPTTQQQPKPQPTTEQEQPKPQPTQAPSGGDGSFQQTMLNSHNKYRSLHSAQPLSWDSKLASFAENYASQYSCSGSLSHSGGPYGENLAITSGGAADAVKMWYDEVNSGYDYSSSFTSSEVSTFGHFTQLVWKSTSKLGCAQKQCSSGTYYICNYDPRGNMLGDGRANIAAN